MRYLRELDEVAYVRFASVYRKFQTKEEFLEELKQLESLGQKGEADEEGSELNSARSGAQEG